MPDFFFLFLNPALAQIATAIASHSCTFIFNSAMLTYITSRTYANLLTEEQYLAQSVQYR